VGFIEVIILSIVEGITEFLPISSTGHLILTSHLLGIKPSAFQGTFEIVIQFGAILAVVAMYSKKFLTSLNLVKKVLVAFVPTAVVGLTLYPFIKTTLLGNPTITLNALFWGGIALIGVEFFLKRKVQATENVSNISYRQALMVGTFQSLSVVPGVSRAAATIIGGLLTGLNRKTATEFSFFLAVPTMFAAASLDLYQSREILVSGNMLTLFIGTVLSFIFAMLAIKFLVNFVQKHDFMIFGVYRILLALTFWYLIT
jgi:undecaprenyl-diphosphatase